jgi:ABC transporter fused permease/ATP-binding protein
MASQQEEVQNPKRLNRSSLKTLTQVWKFMQPYRGWFAAGMVFLVLSTLTILTVPQLAGDFINVANGVDALLPGDLNQLGLLFVLILVAQAFFSFFRIYCFAQVSERSMADIRRALFDRMLGLSIPFYEKRRVGELTSRITSDITQLQELVGMALAEFFRQIATLVLGIAALMIKSPLLTGLMLLVVPLMAVLAMSFGKLIRRFSRQRQDALAQANVVVEETLQNIQTVKSFTNEKLESGRFNVLQDTVVQIAIKAARYRGLFVSFIFLAFLGGLGFVLWYGSTMIEDGPMQSGDLISFIIYTMFIGGSISGMGDLYGRILKSVGASERVFDMLAEESEWEEEKTTKDVEIQGHIEYRNVDFNYPTRPDVSVLRDFSMKINPGQSVALAGPSGSGKSTVAALLLAFYDIQEGEILIDGKSSQTWGRRSLRQHIAVVPQEVILFGGSIRENIAYGKPNASDEEIIQAAQKANAWEFIARFPEKLDTVVGERGIKLSGGQRQRIAIARAILKDPDILILDEATSSLDAESEHLVQEALEGLMKDRTTIVIAHRLSTIRKVDRIYVLDQGSIAEQGSFEELQRENGLFANLLKLQFEENLS